MSRPRSRGLRAVLWAIALLAGASLLLELGLRMAGFGTFPLFEPAASGGYRMRPRQAGRFRRRSGWRYDANGMRNDLTPASFADTTLLIGDSVVDGGLGLDQSQTLAALATRLSGDGFYCVGCHGWGLANILPALRAVPGWDGAKRLVFVLNTGDLDTFNEAESELSFPTRRPFWLTFWLVRRLAYRRPITFRPAHAQRTGPLQSRLSPAVRADNLAAFRQLLANYPGPVVLVRYPRRGEDARAEPYFEQLASLDPRVQILEAAEAPGWSEDCYIDHIHPNGRGVQVLARYLCERLA